MDSKSSSSSQLIKPSSFIGLHSVFTFDISEFIYVMISLWIFLIFLLKNQKLEFSSQNP